MISAGVPDPFEALHRRPTDQISIRVLDPGSLDKGGSRYPRQDYG